MDGYAFRKTDLGFLTPIYFSEVLERESHTMKLEISSMPVEGGGFVTDNATVLPVEVSVSSRMTNSPGVDPGKTKAEFHQVLESIQESARAKELLTVITAHKFYENMMIKGVAGEANNAEFGTFGYTVTFQEVQQAAAVTIMTADVVAVTALAVPGTTEEGATQTVRKSLSKQYADSDIGVVEYMVEGVKAAF